MSHSLGSHEYPYVMKFIIILFFSSASPYVWEVASYIKVIMTVVIITGDNLNFKSL